MDAAARTTPIRPGWHRPSALAWSVGATVLFAVLVSLSLFSGRITQGNDIVFHLYRYFGTVNAWRSGQFVPQLDPLVLDGFGHAPNLFYGPLTAWVAGIGFLFTGSWPWSVNLLLAGSFVASALTMQFFVREISRSNVAGILAAACYVAAPYHLTDIWSRQAHGEAVAFMFIPLVFHGLWRLLWPRSSDRKHWLGGVLLLSAGMGGLVLSHALSAEMVAGAGLIIAVLNLHRLRWRFWSGAGIAAVLAVLISAVFLLPLADLSRSGLYNVFWPDSAFNQHYGAHTGDRTLNLAEIFGIGARNLPPGAMKVPVSTTIGLALMAGTIAAVAATKWMNRRDRCIVVEFGILGVATLLLASKVVPWTYLPSLLWSIQFPFRLLMVASFALSVVVGTGLATLIRAATRRTRRAAVWKATASCAALVVIAATVSGPWLGWWSRPTVDPATLTNALPASRPAMAYAEYLPVQLSDPEQASAWLAKRGTSPIVTKGSAEVADVSYNEAAVDARVSTVQGAEVEFGKIYYPGYEATLTRPDGSVTPLPVSPSSHGLAQVTLPAQAQGTLALTFTTTRLTMAGIALTALGIGGWLGLATVVIVGIAKQRS